MVEFNSEEDRLALIKEKLDKLGANINNIQTGVDRQIISSLMDFYKSLENNMEKANSEIPKERMAFNVFPKPKEAFEALAKAEKKTLEEMFYAMLIFYIKLNED